MLNQILKVKQKELFEIIRISKSKSATFKNVMTNLPLGVLIQQTENNKMHSVFENWSFTTKFDSETWLDVNEKETNI